MTTTSAAEDIQRIVGPVQAGAIRVVAVSAEDRQGVDGWYTLVSVELTPPRGDTWDADDFYEVRRQIREGVVSVLGDQADQHITFTAAGGSDASESTRDTPDDSAGLEKRART